MSDAQSKPGPNAPSEWLAAIERRQTRLLDALEELDQRIEQALTSQATHSSRPTA